MQIKFNKKNLSATSYPRRLNLGHYKGRSPGLCINVEERLPESFSVACCSQLAITVAGPHRI